MILLIMTGLFVPLTGGDKDLNLYLLVILLLELIIGILYQLSQI